MEDLELLAQKYNDLTAALSMLGTWAAILVALWLASKTTKPRIAVFVDKSEYIPSEAQEGDVVDRDLCEEAIAVTMQNKGSATVYITYWSFYWKLPKPWASGIQQNPYYPNFKSEPIKLEPNQSTSIILTNNLEQHRDALRYLCNQSKLPHFMRKFVRLYVYSSDGTQFAGRFGKNYKEEFFRNCPT